MGVGQMLGLAGAVRISFFKSFRAIVKATLVKSKIAQMSSQNIKRRLRAICYHLKVLEPNRARQYLEFECRQTQASKVMVTNRYQVQPT